MAKPRFRALTRIMPKGPAHLYRTYSVEAPPWHWKPAGCAEADCANRRHGWRIHVQTVAGLANGDLLLRDIKASGKRYRVVDEGPGKTYWEFEAGQTCFDGDLMRHKIRIGRPELFLVKGGDWRGNPRGEQTQILTPENWVDSIQNLRDKLMTRHARG